MNLFFYSLELLKTTYSGLSDGPLLKIRFVGTLSPQIKLAVVVEFGGLVEARSAPSRTQRRPVLYTVGSSCSAILLPTVCDFKSFAPSNSAVQKLKQKR